MTRYTLNRGSGRRCVQVLVLCLLVSACELVEPEAERMAPRDLTAAERQLTDADNRFGLKLFRALSEDAPGENVFVSPLSVSMALGMTLNGARGETYEEMRRALELAGLSQPEINQAYQSLIELLTGLDPRVAFQIANSIWYRHGFDVEPDFLEANKNYFDAEVRGLDFSDPASVGVINGWVDAKTHGKIPEIIGPPIDPLTMMFLINAVYFKGTWTYEFDASETREEDFTRHDGSTTRVAMMRQEADLPYFETEAFQAVELPYGDSLYSMTVLLPRHGFSVDDLVAGIDQNTWSEWMGRFATRAIDLRLPRFKLEYEESLNDVLKALGMEAAFDPDLSDFSGINLVHDDLHVSLVKHKSFVEVNEEGTEAAAATVVEVGIVCAGCDGSLVPVHVDRPFVFSIRERHTGSLLFVGKVNGL